MSERERPSSEFLSEAQEVVEEFSRNLLEIDAQQRTGDYDPDLLNAAFRAIHSLKGLASLFGAGSIAALSHALESALDGLRLGRLPLSQEALDLLFEAVEVFGRMLAAFGRGEPDAIDPRPCSRACPGWARAPRRRCRGRCWAGSTSRSSGCSPSTRSTVCGRTSAWAGRCTGCTPRSTCWPSTSGSRPSRTR